MQEKDFRNKVVRGEMETKKGHKQKKTPKPKKQNLQKNSPKEQHNRLYTTLVDFSGTHEEEPNNNGKNCSTHLSSSSVGKGSPNLRATSQSISGLTPHPPPSNRRQNTPDPPPTPPPFGQQSDQILAVHGRLQRLEDNLQDVFGQLKVLPLQLASAMNSDLCHVDEII